MEEGREAGTTGRGGKATSQNIVKMRIGGFRTTPWLAQRQLASPRYARQCPCCQKKVPETIVHIMLRCKRWKEERRRWIGELATEAKAMASRNEDLGKAQRCVTLLLGGEMNRTTLKTWDNIPNPPPGSPQEGNRRLVNGSNRVLALSHRVKIRESGCLRVAVFLQEVVRARAPIIRAIRLAHESAQDRRPDG